MSKSYKKVHFVDDEYRIKHKKASPYRRLNKNVLKLFSIEEKQNANSRRSQNQTGPAEDSKTV